MAARPGRELCEVELGRPVPVWVTVAGSSVSTQVSSPQCCEETHALVKHKVKRLWFPFPCRAQGVPVCAAAFTHLKIPWAHKAEGENQKMCFVSGIGNNAVCCL